MTRRHSAHLLVFLLTAVPATAESSSRRPVVVSPGDATRLVGVDDRCPTFSWGQISEADSYELVVYRVADEDEEAPVVLRAAIDGRAGSWTPTLGRCLDRGGRYAWSLRARHGEAVSGWSRPALFQVAAGPTVAELDEALAVLRSYAGERGTFEPKKGMAEVSATSSPGTGKGTPTDHAKRRAAGDGQGDPTGQRGPDAIGMSVDGRIEAGSFSGDGSGLANVAAADLACAGCVAGPELADGAVTAAKIGATCTSGQVLMRAAGGWQCATLTAPACTPGDEISCYTGPAGTRGVGECLGGTRVCVADSTWGACAGESTPAAAELCDGLDNTCDDSIDEGDPTALCPPTANVASTLCDAAACLVASCDPLWADADSSYANGCEAPAPGACLDGGSPRAIVAPGEGDLVIQEFLADPATPLTDASAEWFEVAVKADFDLNGIDIGTTFGTVIDKIDTADCLSVQDGELLLFARSANPVTNGNLAADWTFSFSLVNGGGDLHLAHDGSLIDAISWTGGEVSPGQARNLPAAFQDATANDNQANWCTVPADAGLLYSDGNHGTPGLVNVTCP